MHDRSFVVLVDRPRGIHVAPSEEQVDRVSHRTRQWWMPAEIVASKSTVKSQQARPVLGLAQVYRSSYRVGLVSLNGIVVAPGRIGHDDTGRTPQVKDAREPVVRGGYARFEGGSGKKLAMGVDHGGPRETDRPEPGSPIFRPASYPTNPLLSWRQAWAARWVRYADCVLLG